MYYFVALLILQGVFVAIVFCYMNGEVRNEVLIFLKTKLKIISVRIIFKLRYKHIRNAIV